MAVAAVAGVASAVAAAEVAEAAEAAEAAAAAAEAAEAAAAAEAANNRTPPTSLTGWLRHSARAVLGRNSVVASTLRRLTPDESLRRFANVRACGDCVAFWKRHH
jgi:hypothetical protein